MTNIKKDMNGEIWPKREGGAKIFALVLCKKIVQFR